MEPKEVNYHLEIFSVFFFTGLNINIFICIGQTSPVLKKKT